jgi:hypothetical protein
MNAHEIEKPTENLTGSDERSSQEWFDRPPPLPSVFPSERPSQLPPPRRAGAPLASAVGCAIGGAVGGALALAAYCAVTAGGVHPLAAVGVAVVCPGLGGLFGRLSRRLFGRPLRMAWATSVAVSLWLFVYAFVLLRVAPGAARAILFLPTLPGAVLYGICVGAVPPLESREERGHRV